MKAVYIVLIYLSCYTLLTANSLPADHQIDKKRGHIILEWLN